MDAHLLGNSLGGPEANGMVERCDKGEQPLPLFSLIPKCAIIAPVVKQSNRLMSLFVRVAKYQHVTEFLVAQV
jgi:hypothetical protein